MTRSKPRRPGSPTPQLYPSGVWPLGSCALTQACRWSIEQGPYGPAPDVAAAAQEAVGGSGCFLNGSWVGFLNKKVKRTQCAARGIHSQHHRTTVRQLAVRGVDSNPEGVQLSRPCAPEPPLPCRALGVLALSDACSSIPSGSKDNRENIPNAIRGYRRNQALPIVLD